MCPYAVEIFKRLAQGGGTLILMIDQSKVASGHEILMVSVRLRDRAVPVMWKVVQTSGELFLWEIDFMVLQI